MIRDKIGNFGLIELLVSVCFITNISQLPIFVENGLTQLILFPVWIIAIGSIIFSKKIKFVKRMGFVSTCVSIFLFGQLFSTLLKGENYLFTSLSYPFYLSIIIFCLGYLYIDNASDKDLEKISTAYIASIFIVVVVVYFGFFMDGLSLDTRVYAYSSKNSISQIIMTSIVLLVLVWKPIRIPVKICKYAIGAFLLFMLLILKSRASIIGLVIMAGVILVKKWSNRYIRYSFFAFIAIVSLLLIFNKDFFNLLINNILLANRNLHDLDELSSGRLSILKAFPSLIQHDILLGVGSYYFELFYLGSILQHGILFGPILIAVAAYPLVWITKNSKLHNNIDLAFFIITLCYLFNGMFEGLAPYGPGAKCYFLWLMFGILKQRVDRKSGKFYYIQLQDDLFRLLIPYSKALWKKALKYVPYYILLFVVNIFLRGNHFFHLKNVLLNTAGINCDEKTKVIAPIKIDPDARVSFGEHSLIGPYFAVHGNGEVIIGENCDIDAKTAFITSSHKIGQSHHRAGQKVTYTIKVNQGTWIGSNSILTGDIEIGKGCVVEANSFVRQSINDDGYYSKCRTMSINEIS